MRIRILGSAAGGGLPQWNCCCPNCEAARAGSTDVLPRTQSSIAVSADNRHWFLFNVSPDVRQQILATPDLAPRGAEGRSTAIAGCVLTDAELDHTSGLLLLREGCSFGVMSTAVVRRWLNRFLPIEPILSKFALRPWTELELNEPVDLPLVDGTSSGLQLRAFELDRHVPKFAAADSVEAAGSVIGLHIQDLKTRGTLVYAPCVASINESLIEAAKHADCVLLDGTFWTNDEPIESGIGQRTACEMGHLPVSESQGSLSWLATLSARHRGFVHINNTNPMLNRRGPEHQRVSDSGLQVGFDGQLFDV